jgi:hypothetical protein
VTICIGYVLACNARYMAAKACGDGRPHGTATCEGGTLGDELEVSKLGILLPRSIGGRGVSGDHNIPKTDVTNVISYCEQQPQIPYEFHTGIAASQQQQMQ